MIFKYMVAISKCFLPLVCWAMLASCGNSSSVKVSGKKDSASSAATNTPPSTTVPTPGDYELETDTVAEKPSRPAPRNIRALPVKKVGELILSDSIKAINDEVVSFMLLDSLSAESRRSRDFYFKVFNKIMDHSGGALSDAIGDYALSYVESYPNEFLANSRNFSGNRLETWASHIGIELFLSSGDVKDIYDKTTQSFQTNCKGCDAATLARLNDFNKLIWTTIEQNKKGK